jgi:hypothetical protein
MLGECIGVSAPPDQGIRTAIIQLPNGMAHAPVTLVDSGFVGTSASQTCFVVVRAGRDVAGVAAHTTSGLLVRASLAAGYYLAWWPNRAGLASLTVTGPKGAVMTTIKPPNAAQPQAPIYYGQRGACPRSAWH